ncbi:hypothetical protein TWF696_007314 [Orbilia brochopaga]|uniref:BTB domain-containing protein n=1 Tax=Orbilia brochopaga TaxID=3140254 RepID=A0AAV9UUU9_9PEZI
MMPYNSDQQIYEEITRPDSPVAKRLRISPPSPPPPPPPTSANNVNVDEDIEMQMLPEPAPQPPINPVPRAPVPRSNFNLKVYVGNPVNIFRVNRAIVCERSSFFAAACYGRFGQPQTTKVYIREIEPRIFNIILGYIYNNRFNEADHSIPDIGKVLEATDYLGIVYFRDRFLAQVWEQLQAIIDVRAIFIENWTERGRIARSFVRVLKPEYVTMLFTALYRTFYDESKVNMIVHEYLLTGGLEEWHTDPDFVAMLDANERLRSVIRQAWVGNGGEMIWSVNPAVDEDTHMSH